MLHNNKTNEKERESDPLLLESGDELVDGPLGLGDLELAPLSGKVQDAATSDTGEDGAIKRRRDELLLSLGIDPEAEEVHGADLRHVVVEQPEDLLEATLAGELGRLDGRRVVAIQHEHIELRASSKETSTDDRTLQS